MLSLLVFVTLSLTSLVASSVEPLRHNKGPLSGDIFTGLLAGFLYDSGGFMLFFK
jgi:hypothetical protein